jgi:predicted nucleic acid-binding protein
MMRNIILDSGPLGMVTNPRASGLTLECQLWLDRQIQARSTILIPEITDYEVRRELIRAGRLRGVQQLDQLKAALEYIPLTTEMMKAAELWAEVRQQGLPTADPNALDGDVILAAQTLIIAQQRQQEIIIATTNVGHLSRFTIAQDWQTIT